MVPETPALAEAGQAPVGASGEAGWAGGRGQSREEMRLCCKTHVGLFIVSVPHRKKKSGALTWAASRPAGLVRCHDVTQARLWKLLLRSCQLFSGWRPRGISWQEKAPSCLPKAQHPPPRGRGGPGGFPGYCARPGGLSGGDPVRCGPDTRPAATAWQGTGSGPCSGLGGWGAGREAVL